MYRIIKYMRWYEWPFSNVLNIATNWPQNGRCVASCSRSSMLRFGSMQTVCSPMEKRSPPVCQSRSCNPIASLCWLTAAAAATTKRRRLTRRTLLSVDGGAAATFCMRPRISGQHLRVVEIYTHACGSVIPYWIILHGCPVAEWWRPVNFFLILHIRSMDQQRERKREKETRICWLSAAAAGFQSSLRWQPAWHYNATNNNETLQLARD